jgi:type IV secretory pathway component VirB8
MADYERKKKERKTKHLNKKKRGIIKMTMIVFTVIGLALMFEIAIVAAMLGN